MEEAGETGHWDDWFVASLVERRHHVVVVKLQTGELHCQNR